MQRSLSTLLAISAFYLTGAAFGQNLPMSFAPDRKEVFGAVGVGKTYDDEGSLGSGLNVAGGFGYRLSRRIGVEAEVNYFRTRREFSAPFSPFQASGVHAMGSGLLYLNRGRAQTYLLLGGGLMHTHLENGFAAAANRAANGFAVDLGGGIKIHVSSHISLRPELRIYTGDSGGAAEAPLSDIRVSMGVGYHW